MREIKFRAWDKVYKQMSPEFVLFGEFTLLGAVHDWQWEITGKGPEEVKDYSSLLRLNDLEVMQFTGLKDKNGTPIYEGDIVHLDNYQPGYNHTIVFHDSRFCWESPEGGYSDYIHTPTTEVIGNIYEKEGIKK